MSREAEQVKLLERELAKRDNQIRDFQMAEVLKQQEEAATLRKVEEERLARERVDAMEKEKVRVCKSEWINHLIVKESGGMENASIFDPVLIGERADAAMKTRGLLPPGLEEVDLRHLWQIDNSNVPNPGTGLSPMERMNKVLAGMKAKV